MNLYGPIVTVNIPLPVGYRAVGIRRVDGENKSGICCSDSSLYFEIDVKRTSRAGGQVCVANRETDLHRN